MTYGGNIVDWMLMIHGQSVANLPIEQIRLFVIETVAQACGVSVTDITSKSRKAEFVRARHIVAWALYRPCYDGYANPRGATAVGRFLNCDHATILHGNRQIKNLIEVDKTGRWQVATIAAELKRGGYDYPFEKLNKTVAEWDKKMSNPKAKKLRKT